MHALKRFSLWLIRIWKSGTWGKAGLGAAILLLLGAVAPRPVRSVVPAVPLPTVVPLIQLAAAPSPTPTAAVPERLPDAPPAAPPTPTRTLAVGAAVNLRSGPGAAFAMLRTLDAAEPVTFESKQTFQNVVWYQIRTGRGESGWISSEAVVIEEALAASLPVSAASFTLPPGP